MGRSQRYIGPVGAFTRVWGRFVLVSLTLWALAMVVPDFYRLVQPLGSFGLRVDGDGRVIDVREAFSVEADSPAWQAGLRPGDRLDLARMRCIPLDTLRCATAQAVLGKLPYVDDGRRGELALLAAGDRPARSIEIVARSRPFSWWGTAILPLDQLAGIFVILGAAWLVWTRPGGMTWGFFLYIIWFNPGQSYQFYAWLQTHSAALLAQNLAGAVAQGAGYAGFLLFALRAPKDRIAPRWRPVEKALPAVAGLLGLILLLSGANLFGFPTEGFARAGLFSGFAVAAGALFLLLARRGEQQPLEYQRLRWVIWGCLIGLPSLTLADIGQNTTLLDNFLGAPDAFWECLRLINGVLCLFVFEAARRPVVVNVAIPLRRVTLLGLLMSAPAMLLHHQYEHLSEGFRENLELPGWVWLALATLAVFFISRLHELATHYADRFFHRAVARTGDELGQKMLRAPDFATLENLLAGEVRDRLKLASAALFRKEDAVFRRSPGAGGWDERDASTLKLEAPALRPFDVAEDFALGAPLPEGLARPVFAVPVADRFECHALALYGPHVTGADLDEDERATLARLGGLAGEVWAKLDHESLRRQFEALKRESEALAAKSAAGREIDL